MVKCLVVEHRTDICIVKYAALITRVMARMPGQNHEDIIPRTWLTHENSRIIEMNN